MRKKGTKNRLYSMEFKIAVTEDIRSNHIGYREAARKYGLGDTGGAADMLQRWERVYLEEGAEGLMKERRGRSDGNKIGRPPKLDKAIEKDLIAEVQRLRLENAYLKKLHALALSKIESENKTKPE